MIFYHSDAQKEAAEAIIRELEADRVFGNPIVTQVRAADVFYPAEDYHQNYFRTHPNQPYCSFIISPKLKKFREKLARYSSAS